ncbi:MAG: hypothetical protein H0U46_00680, partial [Actinobacteria bacterium]|nr:hypothetical protein [Actinomycetota bacterium]
MAEARAQIQVPLRAVELARPRIVEPTDRLSRLHTYFVEGCGEDVRLALESLLERAHGVSAACGVGDVGDDLGSVWYAASAVVELAAALELDAADIRGAAAAVAEACA